MSDALTRTTMKPKIAIIYSLARSGATLMSRCIGCASGNVLLSEVNPRFSWFNPLVQAYQWYGLFSDREIMQFQSMQNLRYADAILRISEKCRERGLNLIVRDWTHIDFTPGDYPVPAIYALSQEMALRDHFEIAQVAIVRHPLDTYLSVGKVPRIKDRLSLNDYMAGFLKFARMAKSIGFVRYEDFCARPCTIIKGVCDTLGVDYADDFETRYATFTKVTGDIYGAKDTETVTGDAVGLRNKREIGLPPRREIPADVERDLAGCADYHVALETLGYTGR